MSGRGSSSIAVNNNMPQKQQLKANKGKEVMVNSVQNHHQSMNKSRAGTNSTNNHDVNEYSIPEWKLNSLCAPTMRGIMHLGGCGF